MRTRRGALALVATLGTAVMLATTAFGAPPARMEGAGNAATGTGEVLLRASWTFTPELQNALDRSVATQRLGASVPLADVLDDSTTVLTSRPSGGLLRWKGACGRWDDIIKPLDRKKRVSAWCFDRTDQSSVSWVPQGVASTAEASANGRVQGQRATAVSWYRRTIPDKSSRGIRVSLFRTPTGGRTVHYNHVALVVPSVDAKGYLTFSDLRIHAGGLAWYGPYLFVPDTSRGVRVFDTRQIHPVALGSSTGAARAAATPTAVDARYVVFQVGTYLMPRKGCGGVAPLPLCFSTLSIDRSTSPPRLVAAEFLSKSEYGSLRRGASVAAWDLGPDSLPALESDGITARSDNVLINYAHSLQGLAVDQTRREMYTSSSTIKNGWFWYERDGDGKAPRKTSEWPAGAESLTVGRSGKLWSVSELVYRRVVFSVKACEMRGGGKRCS